MTSTEARDEIFGMLITEWNSRATTFSTVDPPEPPQIYWQGREYDSPPVKGIPHARATVVHTIGNQASLGPTGARLFERRGLITVQCFGPGGSGNKGLTIAEGLATIAKDAYEGRASPNGIWFRNAQIREIGNEDGWFQVIAQVEFSYDEVK